MGQQDFHQVDKALHLALDLSLSVSVTSADLDTPPPALLGHLEVPAQVPFTDQQTLASAREVDSPHLPLGQQAAVLDQVVYLEPQASARELHLEPLAMDLEQPPEAAALS